jgi:hypothetical protein
MVVSKDEVKDLPQYTILGRFVTEYHDCASFITSVVTVSSRRSNLIFFPLFFFSSLVQIISLLNIAKLLDGNEFIPVGLLGIPSEDGIQVKVMF